ncbi:uncharacterized protein LOC129232227 [Uloborus diversus]|uniref:uncharacterized protein LOC129232227 n=1 Tax=Uloborus diversus TaxID=327109 RepID=UPI00240A7ABD|nr:uncharacterized protein LOC129232227 [Uloborus diversus]
MAASLSLKRKDNWADDETFALVNIWHENLSNLRKMTDMSLEEDCQEGGALPNQLPAADPVEDVGVGSPRPELPELEPVAGPSNQEDSVAPQRPKRRRVEGGKKTRFLGELLQKFNNIQQNYNDNSKEMLNIMKQSVENDASIIEVLKEQTNVQRDLLNK